MTEEKPKVADIMAMFSRCWEPLWECLKVGGEKHGWESFREHDTDLFINAGARHNIKVKKYHKSWDEDGFSHAAAVLANALMVLENIEAAKEKGHCDSPFNDPAFFEWLAGEGLTCHDGVIYDHEENQISQEDVKQVLKDYEESKSEVAVGEPETDEDSEVVCLEEFEASFEITATGWHSDLGFELEPSNEESWNEAMRRMYSEYLAECRDAKDRTKAD